MNRRQAIETVFVGGLVLSVISAGIGALNCISGIEDNKDDTLEAMVKVGSLLNEPEGDRSIDYIFVECARTDGRKAILNFASDSFDAYPEEGSYISVKYEHNKRSNKAQWSVLSYQPITQEVFEAQRKASMSGRAEAGSGVGGR